MDAMSALGSLIITEGATAPLIVAPPEQLGDVLVEGPAISPATPEQQRAVDTVFMSHAAQSASSEQNPAVPFFVITACASALKGVIIDEAGRRLEKDATEEEESQKARERPRSAKT